MAKAEGIPPTASVASAGPGIRYLGQHCYAMSGRYGATQSNQVVLNFTTGSGYIVGTFQCNGSMHYVTAAAGCTTVFKFKFNDIYIAAVKTETDLESAERGTPSQTNFKIIIPPFTHVLVQADSSEDDTDEMSAVTFAGRVYDV